MRLLAAFLLTLLPLLSMAGIPVYVLLQLDVINSGSRAVSNPSELTNQFNQLKSAGVKGVSSDFWWGLIERDGPGAYHWDGYKQLLDICRQTGLKMVPVLSFHQCGGNVGDACDIPLPAWVKNASDSNIFYKDAQGFSTEEYLSLGVDHESIFPSNSGSKRTALDLYTDLMVDFKQSILSSYSDVIDQVHISLGPASEMRYPSYPLQKWSFCGVGEFICYDKYMLANLASAASAAGHPEWGSAGPNNAGNYNSYPTNTGFFSENGGDNYKSDYGRFFLNWYSQQLINHGVAIIGSAHKVFAGSVEIAAKVSGIHWWYNSPHHAAELTAGYTNTDGQNFYLKAATALKQVGLDILVFTCMEMRDSQQPASCSSGPYELVQQVKSAAGTVGLKFAGENALPRFDSDAYSVILDQSTKSFHSEEFTYLRLGSDLLSGNNFGTFKNFVNEMNNA